jgi:hypothetical protein
LGGYDPSKSHRELTRFNSSVFFLLYFDDAGRIARVLERPFQYN